MSFKAVCPPIPVAKITVAPYNKCMVQHSRNTCRILKIKIFNHFTNDITWKKLLKSNTSFCASFISIESMHGVFLKLRKRYQQTHENKDEENVEVYTC